jgi:hypothetical protein
MDDDNTNFDSTQFLKVINSIEIRIEREDIFYREKYNDIMNYFKVMLTENTNALINDYSKIINLKGVLLINIGQNSDINDFLKLICKNYYLDFIELNYEKVYFNQEVFLQNFNAIMENIISIETNNKKPKDDNDNSLNMEYESHIKKLIIIDEHKLKLRSNKEINLLEVFINSKFSERNFIESKTILIWINDLMEKVARNSQKIFNIFDLFINIPALDQVEREAVLRHFSEVFPKIVFDLDMMVNYTKFWEVNDIKNLIKLGIFKHFLKSELNEKSNEITDLLIELIESREFIPSINFDTKNNQLIISENHLIQKQNKGNIKMMDMKYVEEINTYLEEIKGETISDFMLSQLYENAASKNYKELQIIIEKINKGEILEENDRLILARYPFILNENPNKALIALEKAKKTISRISQIFRKV